MLSAPVKITPLEMCASMSSWLKTLFSQTLPGRGYSFEPPSSLHLQRAEHSGMARSTVLPPTDPACITAPPSAIACYVLKYRTLLVASF